MKIQDTMIWIKLFFLMLHVVMSIFAYSSHKKILKFSPLNSLIHFSTISDQDDAIPYLRQNDSEVNRHSRFGLKTIGIVRSPYKIRYQTPKQATIYDTNTKTTRQGEIEIFDEYLDCLVGLHEFDYVWIISYFHLNSGFKSKIKPQPNPNLEAKSGSQLSESVGLFCSRSPHRPNPIGLSALKIVSIKENKIIVDGLDILDGTPVIDVKPYVPAFDCFTHAKAGWMDKISINIDEVRTKGYQSIYSARGARSTRAGNRKRQSFTSTEAETPVVDSSD